MTARVSLVYPVRIRDRNSIDFPYSRIRNDIDTSNRCYIEEREAKKWKNRQTR